MGIKSVRYTDEASLLYMANLGCIEMNPWSSTTQHPDQPDWCVLDFDPDKNNTFEQQELPEITSLERPVDKRKGKIYLDFLQNKTQATLAAPYSVRPKPGAPVSMPLNWKEVQPGLQITDFNIHNAIDLLQTRGDLFKGALGKGIDMTAALKSQEAILQKA